MVSVPQGTDRSKRIEHNRPGVRWAAKRRRHPRTPNENRLAHMVGRALRRLHTAACCSIPKLMACCKGPTAPAAVLPCCAFGGMGCLQTRWPPHAPAEPPATPSLSSTAVAGAPDAACPHLPASPPGARVLLPSAQAPATHRRFPRSTSNHARRACNLRGGGPAGCGRCPRRRAAAIHHPDAAGEAGAATLHHQGAEMRLGVQGNVDARTCRPPSLLVLSGGGAAPGRCGWLRLVPRRCNGGWPTPPVLPLPSLALPR